MLRVKSKIDKYSVFVMIAFFIIMLMMYARGINYNGEAVEKGLIIVRKEPSKAPFLIITTILLFLLNRNRINFKLISNYKLWGAFFLCLFLLIFFRGNLADDINNFGNTIFSYLLLLGLMRFVYRIKFSVLEDCFIIISVLILVLCVTFHFAQGHHLIFFPDRSDDNFERLGGMFYYAHTAAIAAITLLFSLNKYLRSKKIKYLVIVLFSFILLIATDTRSAWVATIFSLIFIFLKNIKFHKIFLFCIGLYLIFSYYSTVLGSNKTLSQGNDDTEYRMKIWLFSIEKASQKLLTGYGSEIDNVFVNFSETDNLHDPHNSIISLLLQSGLIAVIIYIVIYFKNCITSNDSYNTDYRFLYFFWFFFSFFWGNLFNNLSSFISMYIMFTLYAFTLYPSFEIKKSLTKLQLSKVNY